MHWPDTCWTGARKNMAAVNNKVRLDKAFIGLRPSKYVMELKRVQFFMIPDLWRIVEV